MATPGAAVGLPRPAGGSGSARAAWRRFRRHRGGLFGLAIVALLVAVAVLAPVLAPHDPFTTSRNAFLPPLASDAHPLGTDHLGRDLLSNLIWGARVSLIVGVAAALTATVIGVIVGAFAGYAGGRSDELLPMVQQELDPAKRRELIREFEKHLLTQAYQFPTIWWHRIIERKGFCLNGFINHYPDFMVQTTRGRIVLIETKGDYLWNDESRAKLHLGRKWQELCGQNYRYCMVFGDKDAEVEGAYRFAQFIETMKRL